MALHMVEFPLNMALPNGFPGSVNQVAVRGLSYLRLPRVGDNFDGRQTIAPYQDDHPVGFSFQFGFGVLYQNNNNKENENTTTQRTTVSFHPTMNEPTEVLMPAPSTVTLVGDIKGTLEYVKPIKKLLVFACGPSIT